MTFKDNKMEWKTFALYPECSVKLIDYKTELSINLEKRIENLWVAKKRLYPNLFNGRVFTVTLIFPHQITGYWTEYRYVSAQMENKEFNEFLCLKPLAVTGLIFCDNGFILGKRNSNSVYLPNYWQCAPAGSVESRHEEKTVNLHEQLFVEAREELGLKKDFFSNSRILIATQHPEKGIIDIGIMLKTHLNFQQIYNYWQKKGNSEYDELICISDLTLLPKPIIPSTRYLIKASYKDNNRI